MTGRGCIVVRLSSNPAHRQAKQFKEHPNLTEAGIEAQRLADAEGDTFVVYEPFSRFHPRSKTSKDRRREARSSLVRAFEKGIAIGKARADEEIRRQRAIVAEMERHLTNVMDQNRHLSRAWLDATASNSAIPSHISESGK